MTLSTATIVNVLAAGDTAKAIQIRTVEVTAAYCHKNRPYPKPSCAQEIEDRLPSDPYASVANGCYLRWGSGPRACFMPAGRRLPRRQR